MFQELSPQICDKQLSASSSLSARLNVTTTRISHHTEFSIWGFLRTLSRKFKMHSHLKKITSTLHEYQYTFFIWLSLSYLEWKMFQTEVVEKIKTRVLCSMSPSHPRKSWRSWNVKKYGTARQATDNNIIERMRTACWITKVTDTNSEYIKLSCGIPVVLEIIRWGK